MTRRELGGSHEAVRSTKRPARELAGLPSCSGTGVALISTLAGCRSRKCDLQHMQPIKSPIQSSNARPLAGGPAEKRARYRLSTGSGAHRSCRKAVEEIVGRLQIQTIRAKLELCRIVCASLAAQFDNPQLSCREKAIIAGQWDKLLIEGDILAFFLELLRRRGREQIS